VSDDLSFGPADGTNQAAIYPGTAHPGSPSPCDTTTRRNPLAAYRGQTAWPELIHGRPAVVYPHQLATLPARGSDGWCGQRQLEGWAEPHPLWSAVLDGQQLTVTGPGGQWYTGLLAVTRDWRRAARTAVAVLQITGEFTNPLEFPAAASAGLLRLCVVKLVFAGSAASTSMSG
jgi:hypothetical protein